MELASIKVATIQIPIKIKGEDKQNGNFSNQSILTDEEQAIESIDSTILRSLNNYSTTASVSENFFVATSVASTCYATALRAVAALTGVGRPPGLYTYTATPNVLFPPTDA